MFNCKFYPCLVPLCHIPFMFGFGSNKRIGKTTVKSAADLFSISDDLRHVIESAQNHENDASNATKEDELKILDKGKSKSIHFPHVTALKQHYSKVLE